MSLSLPQRLAVAEFLAKRFSAVRKNELNPEAAGTMIPGERHAAKFGPPGDEQVAAWVSVPQPSVRVQDKDALLAWCEKHLPDAVERVPQVRPETAKALAEQVRKFGGWLDRETGEIVPVDGIGESDPYPRVVLDRAAEEILAAAWGRGEIDLGGMLALEAAPGGDDGE